MLIYNYHGETGEYLGTSFADPDPLEPGRYVLPANSTTIPLYEFPNVGEVAVFDGLNWTNVIDLRGAKYWLDGIEYTITDLGVMVPVGASMTEPPTNPEVITNIHVNEERNRRVAGVYGVIVRPPVLDPSNGEVLEEALEVFVSGDGQTKINLMALAQAATLRLQQGLVDHITYYRDELDTIHQLTPMEIVNLWSQGSEIVSRIYAASWALKDNPEGIPSDYMEDYHWSLS